MGGTGLVTPSALTDMAADSLHDKFDDRVNKLSRGNVDAEMEVTGSAVRYIPAHVVETTTTSQTSTQRDKDEKFDASQDRKLRYTMKGNMGKGTKEYGQSTIKDNDEIDDDGWSNVHIDGNGDLIEMPGGIA